MAVEQREIADRRIDERARVNDIAYLSAFHEGYGVRCLFDFGYRNPEGGDLGGGVGRRPDVHPGVAELLRKGDDLGQVVVIDGHEHSDRGAFRGNSHIVSRGAKPLEHRLGIRFSDAENLAR